MWKSVRAGPAPPVGILRVIVLTSYFLGELDALRVRQGFGLLVDVLYVQHLAHELYHRLSSVESGRRH